MGRPVANTRVYVLDARGEPTPIGVPGELCIAGVQVGLGYHGRPELTAERFVPDRFAPNVLHAPRSTLAESNDGVSVERGAWSLEGPRMYRTGDLARWRADGTLEFLGRLDFQVKLRGFRVELGEIETALAQHARVRSAAVVARDDGRGDARLVAYVVPRALPGDAGAGFTDETVAAWRAHLGATLPEYMVPAVFVRLDALPLTPSGKVDRRALPEASTQRAARAYVAPRTESERALAAVWADVLKAERVGADDGFLALGGHSLTAMRVVGRVRSELGVVLPLASLLRGDTLAQLAAQLDELQASSAASTDEPEDEFALAPVGRDAFRRAGPASGGRS
jgi:acyl carrier protein